MKNPHPLCGGVQINYYFCYYSEEKGNGLKTRNRQRSLGLSEIMTILIAFHQSHYRNFKSDYSHQVRQYWSGAFPRLLIYSRFVTWMPSCMMPLLLLSEDLLRGGYGIGFVDATRLNVCDNVCDNYRIGSHQVSKGVAARRKTSVDWFYGLKLRLVVNECGALLDITVTRGIPLCGPIA